MNKGINLDKVLAIDVLTVVAIAVIGALLGLINQLNDFGKVINIERHTALSSV